MPKWLLIVLFALQTHFAASYLVPLDEQAQATFGGLLRWAWPWSIGDRGPLGEMTSTGFPLAGFFLAMTAVGLLALAMLSVFRLWVPFGWWRVLAIAGAACSLVLMVLFLSLTKLVPIGTAVVIVAAALDYWSPVATR